MKCRFSVKGSLRVFSSSPVYDLKLCLFGDAIDFELAEILSHLAFIITIESHLCALMIINED